MQGCQHSLRVHLGFTGPTTGLGFHVSASQGNPWNFGAFEQPLEPLPPPLRVRSPRAASARRCQSADLGACAEGEGARALHGLVELGWNWDQESAKYALRLSGNRNGAPRKQQIEKGSYFWGSQHGAGWKFQPGSRVSNT